MGKAWVQYPPYCFWEWKISRRAELQSCYNPVTISFFIIRSSFRTRIISILALSAAYNHVIVSTTLMMAYKSLAIYDSQHMSTILYRLKKETVQYYILSEIV